MSQLAAHDPVIGSTTERCADEPFCRDCAWCSPPWPGTMGCPPEWPFCRASEALAFADLVFGSPPPCHEMRCDISASRCGAEGRWFKPKEAPDALVEKVRKA